MMPAIAEVENLIPSCTAQMTPFKNSLLTKHKLTGFQEPIDKQIVTLCIKIGLLKEGSDPYIIVNQALTVQVRIMNTYAPYFTQNLGLFTDELIAQVRKYCAPKISG